MSELSKFPPQTRVAIYNRVSTEKKVQMEALDVQHTRGNWWRTITLRSWISI